MGALSLLGAACMESSECEVTPRERGGSVIRCEGKKPIISEAALPEDARCEARGAHAVCTHGERFDFPEAQGQGDDFNLDVPDGQRDDGEDGPGDNSNVTPGGPFEAPAGSTGPWEVACQQLGAHVVCEDGAKVVADELSAGAQCVSIMVPGVGRRIVCDGACEYLPEAGSVSDIEVTCAAFEIEPLKWGIECSDGTGLLLDDGIDFEDACKPKVSRDGDEVVVTCGASEWRLPISEPCTGTFHLTDDAAQADFAARNCKRWWGDLIIDAASLAGINQLSTLEYISGSLRITDNESLQYFNLPRLTAIGGDLVVRGNPQLREIRGWPRLAWVTGSVEYSANARVEAIANQPRAKIGGSWSITGHERLRTIGLLSQGSWHFTLPTMTIDGALLFFDNTAFGFCRTEILWRWAIAHADTVYLGNTGGQLHSDDWCADLMAAL